VGRDLIDLGRGGRIGRGQGAATARAALAEAVAVAKPGQSHGHGHGHSWAVVSRPGHQPYDLYTYCIRVRLIFYTVFTQVFTVFSDFHC
jgi:hypothetical protein